MGEMGLSTAARPSGGQEGGSAGDQHRGRLTCAATSKRSDGGQHDRPATGAAVIRHGSTEPDVTVGERKAALIGIVHPIVHRYTVSLMPTRFSLPDRDGLFCQTAWMMVECSSGSLARGADNERRQD
jgi:hypothetical protein